ncbi:MAG TPA: phosphotransferase family protein, partial [Solirubrobacteraceae bacterium]|nr:phosphotransferase family protein [Solirubrobacteraceae bacterium]
MLSEQLLELVPGAAEVRGVQRLTGGASRETWSFDALIDGEWRPLVMRSGRSGRGSMTVEALAFDAAAGAGVPEPRIVARGDSFLVMERIEGETIARRILREEKFAALRPLLAEQCGEILARIHSIPREAIPDLEGGDPLTDTAAMIHSFEEPSPALELGLAWLERNRPEPERGVVLHGDFRLGNLIIGEEGVRAVLDWELVHRGDPCQDLGYLCVRAWRFGGEYPVGGFGTYEDLFRGSERISGREVDPARVRWWEVFGTVWWGGACMQQAWRHLSGSDRSVEL